MTPEELLGVTPALLAKSILHRRERLAEVIPEQLDARQEELVAAEPLARAAKEKRDGINTKVASLKRERSEAQTKARVLFKRAGELRDQLQASGGIKDPNPKWAKEKLDAKLASIEQELETNAGNHKTEQKYIQEMKSLIRQHDEWVAELSSSQEGLTEMDASFKEAKALLEKAQKAHDAILEAFLENNFSFPPLKLSISLSNFHISSCSSLKKSINSSENASCTSNYCCSNMNFNCFNNSKYLS